MVLTSGIKQRLNCYDNDFHTVDKPNPFNFEILLLVSNRRAQKCAQLSSMLSDIFPHDFL